jgi:UPF0755 protein
MNLKKKWLPFTIPIVIFGAIVFAFTFIVLNSLITIPQKAETLFGPPADNISGFQKYLVSKHLIKNQDLLITPYSSSNTPIEIIIEENQSVDTILESLLESDIIAETETLLKYLIYTGNDTKIRSGTFFIPPSLPPILIIEEIKRPSLFEIQINVFPGMRVEEIAAQIEAYGIASQAEFLNSIDGFSIQHYEWLSPSQYLNHYEGFIAAGSYQYLPGTPLNELIEKMIAGFEEYLSKEIIEGISKQGLSLYQAVTLASIIERESIISTENPTIASVFYNRLAIDMKLDSDATVQYGIGFNPSQGLWWTNPLLINDLKFDSLYNTYLYKNLPPGPISSISLEALQSVAFPVATNYLFFQAKCDGSGQHNFAINFEAHLENLCN